ncbi:MAG: MATE family efflux transporter [Bacteroidaceae bacterium]
MKENIREQWGTKPIGKLIIAFAIPAIVSGIMGAMYNIVDQIFIGRSIGLLGNAATNVVFPIMTICIGISFMIGLGGSANFSLKLGSGDEHNAAYFVTNALMMSIGMSIVLLVLMFSFFEPLLILCGSTQNVLPYASDYLRVTLYGLPLFMFSFASSHIIRADGSPRFAMGILITGTLINTSLDPILIFTFDMGIAGAAWASVTSQLFTALMSVYYFRYKFKSFPLMRDAFTVHLRVIKRILILGITPLNAFIAMMIVQIVLNNGLIHYGGSSKYGSDIPLAVVGIVTKVNFLFFSIALGIIQGSQPIIGYNYGAKNYDRVLQALTLIMKSIFIIGLIAFSAFQLFPRELTSIFGSGSPEYYEFAERYFKIYLFLIFLVAFQPCSSNYFSAIGKPIYGVIISLSRQIFILLPLLYFLPKYFGIDGILYAGPTADFCSAVITFSFLTREILRLRRLKSENCSLPKS